MYAEHVYDKNQKQYVIRKGCDSDGPELYALITPILISYGLKQKQAADDTVDEDLFQIDERYFGGNGKGFFEVLLNPDDSTTIIGSVGLMSNGDDECELRKMYLKPEYKGLGLGTMLLQRAIDKAKVCYKNQKSVKL